MRVQPRARRDEVAGERAEAVVVRVALEVRGLEASELRLRLGLDG